MRISKTELTNKYNLTRRAWEARHDDLLEHLSDFMNIKEIKINNRYYYDIEGEMPDSIPKLPRKSNKAEKIKDYEEYVIKNLPEEFTPLSKAKMSRDAINDFGYEKYNHTSFKSVSNRYVGPAMDKHGEHGTDMVWVNVSTYQQLTKEQEDYLHDCFCQVHLSEREMANAFKKAAQEEDISEEINNFNRAIDKYKERYGFRPISVYEWKVKK